MSYEVNNVRFGNYSIGNPQQGSQKKANEGQVGQESAQPQNQTQSTFDPNSVMSALGNMGAYNLISINKAEAQAVNPADYLSEERMSDIEAMMAEFEAGVDTIATSIEEEFPGVFAQDYKNALAAQIYAQE